MCNEMTSINCIGENNGVKPRILVVEDQILIATMIDAELRELGFAVVGPAYTLEQAHKLACRNRLDAAVLAYELNSASTADLARALKRRACPVLFISALEFDRIPSDLQECEWLTKPFSHEELALAMRQLIPITDNCKAGDCHACPEI